MGTNPVFPTQPPVFQTGVLQETVMVGNERVVIDNGGSNIVVAPVAAISTDCLLPTVNTNSGASPLALSAANLTGNYGDVIVSLTAVLAAAGVATLPTVVALVANILGGSVPTSGSFTLTVVNRSTGNFAWTLATNTGWTLNGPAANYVIPQYQYNTYLVQFQSQTAATITLVNQGWATA